VGVTPPQSSENGSPEISYFILGVTILLLHGMYDEVSSTPPTSMDSPRIAIPTSQELGMAMLGGCIEVGGEGDTLLYIP
jgi:hypothetical protein